MLVKSFSWSDPFVIIHTSIKATRRRPTCSHDNKEADHVPHKTSVPEKSDLDHLKAQVEYGTRGSIRFDVVQYDKYGNVLKAWDLKTGNAILTQSRVNTMLRCSGLGISINMIK